MMIKTLNQFLKEKAEEFEGQKQITDNFGTFSELEGKTMFITELQEFLEKELV